MESKHIDRIFDHIGTSGDFVYFSMTGIDDYLYGTFKHLMSLDMRHLSWRCEDQLLPMFF